MVCKRAALFRGRHFTDEIIVLCVRWYLRYSLSYRDLTEIMCERNLSIDPSTIWRWVQRYAPELNERIRRESSNLVVPKSRHDASALNASERLRESSYSS